MAGPCHHLGLGLTTAEQTKEAQVMYSEPWYSMRQQQWQIALVLGFLYLLLKIDFLVVVLLQLQA